MSKKQDEIVYAGNNLQKGNPTTMVILSNILTNCSYKVIMYSSYKDRILRMIDMSFGIIKNHNAKVVLIDTYSTYNFYYAFIISQLCRFLRIPYIPILHGGNLPNRLKVNPYLSSLIFKYSYENIAPSNYLKYYFEKQQFTTKLIPNAINKELYNYKQRRIIKPKLLWVRALQKLYNPIMAIKVLEGLLEYNAEAELCIVGPDKDKSLTVLKTYGNSNKLNDRVTFKGYLPKQEWIQLAKEYDIFINTSNFDNIPVSVIEAMALGLPVISTEVGGIPFFIENKENGILVEKNNIQEMIQSVIELCENEKLVSSITFNARNFVLSMDEQIVQKKWRQLLANVN